MGYARKKTSSSPAAPQGAAPAPAQPQGASRSQSIWNIQLGGSRQKTDMKRVEVLGLSLTKNKSTSITKWYYYNRCDFCGEGTDSYRK